MLFVTGCATDKGVTYLEQVNVEPGAKIVILKDEPTRESVLPVLVKWFKDNGYDSTVVMAVSESTPDDYVFSYRAWWGWDIATYMKDVEMTVNKNGERLGALNFDALQYGGFGKFGDAEQRLQILLDVLFGKITVDQANEQLKVTQEETAEPPLR
ncbi:hypothetical protein DU002_11850 [Corallincola holothuriorum]|uniref:Lipoprotein n=2 Tax=Corallincola TaxID=1775176 RepID=A0A368NG97_9GAMM|nr:hypothetical protein DU002_11850 [Corallincola holothuriorum]